MNDYYNGLKVVQQEIDDMTMSDEYKFLAGRNSAWAVPKPTNDETLDWTLLNERLAELECDKKFLQNVILNSTAAYVKKQNSVRKGYKDDATTKSERKLLSSIAERLYAIYAFKSMYVKIPAFGDVMNATGFYSVTDIIDHFRRNQAKENNADGDVDIRDFFTEDEWIYFFRMDESVNQELHSSFAISSSKTVILLKPERYDKEMVSNIMVRIGFDANKLDIKCGDCD